MEEEDELALLDYRSPKGQLIKLLEQKMKKPEIDDSLGKVLDQFSQITNEQSTFLDNGIFQMNFAEDALLLQSCGQYYAKRVDKLWEELLQFHTRMVKYDEVAVKNCSDRGKKEARKLELERLEERLNRGKRKKIRLADPESETPVNGCFVFDIDPNAGQEIFDRPNLLQLEDDEEPAVLPFVFNFEMYDEWREIQLKDEIRRSRHNSAVVSQYNRQTYRFKPYMILDGQDEVFDINDPEEFMTREGRLISAHHIRHLFEYNDRCLLPDEDFTVAKLRFAYILKKKWLVEHKIDADAPYETYKVEYEKYQREFLENEKRKIQNMPQRNSEDLMKFYKALAKKERLAQQAQNKLREAGVKDLPAITFESLILEPLKEGYQGDYDPYIPLDDDEEAQTVATDGDHELELSNLFVDLPNLPHSSAEAAEKLRSDSGYFDGGFEADDESDREYNTDVSVPGTDTPFEFDKDNTESKGEETALDKTTETETTAESLQVGEEAGAEVNAIVDIPALEATDEDSQEGIPASPGTVTDEPEQTNLSVIDEQEAMNREIREFVKVGTENADLSYSILENCFFKRIDDMVVILYNKGEAESIVGESNLDQIIDIGDCFDKPTVKSKKDGKKSEKNETKIKDKEQDSTNEESRKRKLDDCQDQDPLPKRRKLSQKQILKLRKSLIEPVKEIRWESFFSMNYQPETGEGEITRVDYDPASEDEDDILADLLEDDNNHGAVSNVEDEDKNKVPEDLNFSGYHSDHGESHTSDNCRSETPGLPLSQDSGIGDMSTNSRNETQTTETSSGPVMAATSNQESSLLELGNIDILAELSKNTGISREELATQQQEVKQHELTANEQERLKVRERVAEWKEHIMPKLKKLDEHDFDIHEYGSKIMNNINLNQSRPFGELVSGQSSAEVVRFFISSLQLANTMNVEICGAKKGELSNDTFELKLLSKERYHEHLVDYQAPSEECLHEKLMKVKEIRMQNKMKEKKSPTKRKATDEASSNLDQIKQPRPPSIMKRNSARQKIPTVTISTVSTTDSNSVTLSSPSKRIKILNYSMISSDSEPALDNQQVAISPQNVDTDFQQPSTSRQADLIDQRNQQNSAALDALSPISNVTTRSSIDSGFMPSCDEDFLEQFDQLQQTTHTQLRSTPVKPRKVLRVSFARNTNF